MKLHILLSYAYRKTIDFWLKKHDFSNIVLMVDSGAFTVWKSGGSIDINSYINYLKSNIVPNVKEYSAIQLDVIGNAKETRINLIKMCESGLNILPVFTKGEKYEELEELYKYSDYVCCGGLVGSQTDTYIKYLMEKTKGRKIHLLGYGKQKQLKTLQPYSADVSNILDFFRFGKFSHWDKKRAILITVDALTFYNLNYKNSLVTDVSKFKKSCLNTRYKQRHNSTADHNSTAILVIIQQYVLQAVYFYYIHNVKLYFSISSWEVLFSIYMDKIIKSKEVQDYIKLCSTISQKGNV